MRVVPSPCGIEASFPLSDEMEWDRFRSAEVRILFLGRISHWKGVHVAIETVKILNEAASDCVYSLDIAGAALFGEDEYFAAIQELVAGNDNVRLLGHVDQVAELLRGYDALFHCSLIPEPFGQVIVQGMSAGLAVFATRGGGPDEIINDGVDGVLVQAGDSAALAERVLELFSRPDRVRVLRHAANRSAGRYSDEVAVREIDSAVRELVHQVNV
ncbi:glycosyltransferase family 4 protein [Rhodococcus sp. ABRD24]|uniref:glycosyltransferase family 4 protein n=1 Tax=Rhodococcus sp. ABRD24 TaxID=2507582 RepID=UPI0013F15A85|nr:glycosyltransferase family 4 protein [Rhodococcus sp. ABRD24]